MIKLQNSYFELPEEFHSTQNPENVPNPELILFNQKLAEELNLTNNPDAAEIFCGNKLLNNSKPISQSYSGHQFGHFSANLGDGRAILLGEIFDKKNQLFDIQLKGAGRTPYSRNGDGKYPLGPAIREYLVSEAMSYLKISTTRILALVATNQPVHRETTSPGAVLTRIAESHIRVGTFEYFAKRGDYENTKILVDYTISRHYPKCQKSKNPYLSFLKEVMKKQADLVSDWMSIGFIHGVMNTDNIAISGQTLDFGPCAFMDEYKKDQVFSFIDKRGRYSFSNQKNIILWNLTRFAESILPFLDSEIPEAIKLAEIELNKLAEMFDDLYFSKMAKKIGIFDVKLEDRQLIAEFLEILEKNNLDFTNSFRNLPMDCLDENWQKKWKKRICQQKFSEEEIFIKMDKINPAFIPRNHLVEKAIRKAVDENDFNETKNLLKILQTPFKKIDGFDKYYLPAQYEEKISNTFCGT
ncbi:MAG: hypothetical protein ACJA0S_001395 [Rickettsiales bacterium]|jgi:uncharacterized protein YdiU (UPF0061 family)